MVSGRWQHLGWLGGLLCLSSSALLACSDRDEVSVITHYDTQTDFAALLTFHVVEPATQVPGGTTPEATPLPFPYTPATMLELRQTIAEELTALGLMEVADAAQAQLLVAPYVAQTTQQGYGIVYNNFSGPYWGYGWGYGSYPYAVPVQYQVGSLLIDNVQRPGNGEQDKLVFQGLARTLSSRSGFDPIGFLHEAVRRIYDDWPHQPATESAAPRLPF